MKIKPMKKLLTQTFILLVIACSAQPFKFPVDSITKKITYSKIFVFDSTYRESNLYDYVKYWTRTSIENTGLVEDLNDKSFTFFTNFTYVGPDGSKFFRIFLQSEITVQVKGNRVKYNQTEFYYKHREREELKLLYISMDCDSQDPLEALVKCQCDFISKKNYFTAVNTESLRIISSLDENLKLRKRPNRNW